MNKLAVLHPDHLLDRARHGLDPEAWQQLGAHLARCPACAWEQAATADFARERAAAELSQVQLDSLVDGALARAGLAALPAPAEVRAPRRARSMAARCLAVAVMIAIPLGLALAAPGRDAREAAHPSLAAPAAEAGLDAGAAVAVAGSDS